MNHYSPSSVDGKDMSEVVFDELSAMPIVAAASSLKYFRKFVGYNVDFSVSEQVGNETRMEDSEDLSNSRKMRLI